MTKLLKAVALFAATKDVRYYLKSVYFEDNLAIATDGLQMAIAKLPGDPIPTPVIVPIDVVNIALKLPHQGVHLDPVANTLQGIPFAPIDVMYPDWRRVIPAPESLTADKLPQLNPEYLARVDKAAKVLKVHPATHRWLTGPDGDRVVSWFVDVPELVIVTMGLLREPTDCPMKNVLQI